MTKTTVSSAFAFCPTHGKLAYRSRKDAKAAGRSLKRRESGAHPSAYQCDAVDGLWHWGHLTADVVSGKVSRRDIYGVR